ncbi:MAG: uracil-DNA glycosylase [Candidatus Nucleicultricaceae bacterium]
MKKDAIIALLETLKFQDEIGVTDAVHQIPTNKKTFNTFKTLKPEVASFLTPKVEKISPPIVENVVQPSKPTKAPISGMDATTQQKVKQASTLAELKQLIETFDACPLKLTATHTVFSDGQPNAPVMLIGEAPGAEEDKQGKPFVGLSGQLLDRILASVGLTREKNVYISNILSWRPPGNRAPTTQEIALCLPFIQRHIELIQPKVLILLGATATKSILQTNEGIMKIRGQWVDFETPFTQFKVPTMATFHPAFLLRSPGQKKFVWQDFLKVKAILEKH